MRKSPEEKAALRESFRRMEPAKKAEYILDYYKWYILLGLILLFLLGSGFYRSLTKKEPVLYLGLTNVSVGQRLEQDLTEGYLLAKESEPKKKQVKVYKNLYLAENPAAEDHEYSYASRMKIMAAVEAKQLDLVLMNREAYDILSAAGYLLPLEGLGSLSSSLMESNIVVLEDNAIDVQLGNESEHRVITKEETNGLEVSSLPLFDGAGFDGTVYAGIIANSPRSEAAARYLEYLAG